MPELEEKFKKGMIIGERCRALTLFYGFVAKKRVDDLSVELPQEVAQKFMGVMLTAIGEWSRP